MSKAERVFDQVIRDAHDLIARQQKPRRAGETSLTRLLASLDDSKLPPIWKRDAVARWRRSTGR